MKASNLLLTTSARRRYSPAGREAGSLTECLPIGNQISVPCPTTISRLTTVTVDNIGSPLLA